MQSHVFRLKPQTADAAPTEGEGQGLGGAVLFRFRMPNPARVPCHYLRQQDLLQGSCWGALRMYEFNFRFNSTPTSRTQGSTNGRSSCRALGSGTLCSSLGPGNSIFEPWVRERYTRTRLHCQESTGGNLKSTLSPVEWLGDSNGILHLNPRAAATPSSPSSTRPPRPRPAVQPIYVGLLLTFERRDRGLGSGH